MGPVKREELSMNKLAVFDLDGTLFDTTLVNFLSYEKVLEPMGYHPTFEYFKTECFGHDFGYFGPLLAPGATAEELKHIHQAKKACYGAFLDKAVKNEHLFALIRLMRGEYHTALVTAGSKANSSQILAHFGETDCFDLILSNEDVPRAKPDPIGFQMAMAHFGVLPEHTIVFEDSQTGISAAKASGAHLYIVEGYH